MDVDRTKSMYIFSKKFSIEKLKNLNIYKYDGMATMYKKNYKKKFFLNVKRGEFVLFSPNLLHGNICNKTKETRISMNARFKNFFSPYGIKKQFAKRMGYFYMPFKIKPITKFALEFDLPNEF